MALIFNPIIKNTFIHLSRDAVDETRRPRSLPPSIRFGSSVTVDDFECANSSLEASVDDASVTENPACIGKWFTVGAKKVFVPPMPMEAPPPIPAGKLAVIFQSNCPSEELSTEASEDGTSSDVGSSTSGDASMEVESFTRSMHGSNSDARIQGYDFVFSNAWNMSSSTYVVLQVPTSPVKQVVMTTKGLLATCPCLSSVQVSEHSSCWLIVAQMHAPKKLSKGQIMTFAKESLVWACGQTSDVAIFGCHKDQFLAMPKGFAAKVGVVSNKHNVCWNLLQGGVCQYGNCCRWEHPIHQRNIYVKLVE